MYRLIEFIYDVLCLIIEIMHTYFFHQKIICLVYLYLSIFSTLQNNTAKSTIQIDILDKSTI